MTQHSGVKIQAKDGGFFLRAHLSKLHLHKVKPLCIPAAHPCRMTEVHRERLQTEEVWKLEPLSSMLSHRQRYVWISEMC